MNYIYSTKQIKGLGLFTQILKNTLKYLTLANKPLRSNQLLLDMLQRLFSVYVTQA